MKLYTHDHHPITLTDEIGKGGEATVYHVTEYTDLVAKIYHQPTLAHEAKLRAMIANPPEQPATHIAIAWPTELLYQPAKRLRTPDAESVMIQGEFVGFLMPKITGYEPLFKAYNPVLRGQTFPKFTRRALHRIARNLAVAVATVHAKGYVIGDLNESNILVNQQGLVAIVDSDSFQVVDEAGMVHRCNVGKAEYTPPELQGVNFREVDRLMVHDLFSLAVLFFQLLMKGHHPFAGVLMSDLSVGRVDLYAIRQGLYPYSGNAMMMPPPYAQPIDYLHPWLEAAFKKCFVHGHEQPSARPTAAQWLDVLRQAEQDLVVCAVNETHFYASHLAHCPKCPQVNARLAQLNPTLKYRYEQGLAAYAQGDVATVAQIMTQIVGVGAAPATVYAYLGWADYQQGNYDIALHNCTQALELEPKLGLAHRVMGQSLMAQGWLPEAIQAFDQALASEPHAEVYYCRGRARQRLGQTDRAIADFTQAIRHHYTPLSEVYQQRSLAYEKLNQISQAMQDTEAQRQWVTNLTQQNLINTRLEQLEQLLHHDILTPDLSGYVKVNEAALTIAVQTAFYHGFFKRVAIPSFYLGSLGLMALLTLGLFMSGAWVGGLVALVVMAMLTGGLYLIDRWKNFYNLQIQVTRDEIITTYKLLWFNRVYRVPISQVKDVYSETSIYYGNRRSDTPYVLEPSNTPTITYILYVINPNNEYSVLLKGLVDRDQAKFIQNYLRIWLNL